MRIFIRHNMVEKNIYIHISVMSWSRVSGNRTNVGKNHSWEHFGWKIIQLKIGDGLEVLQFAATSNSERRSSELIILWLASAMSQAPQSVHTLARVPNWWTSILVPGAEPYKHVRSSCDAPECLSCFCKIKILFWFLFGLELKIPTLYYDNELKFWSLNRVQNKT